jgi:predicted AlkP superfamily pyrophosphatase or phosphodiesterase
MNKVILISIDGMRPDGFLSCGNPYIHELMAKGSYTLDARTVFPSVTLPCHMSMFHSVTPERHGITTNIFIPLARPLNGLFEQIKLFGGKCAMFYGWEPLRDIYRPGSVQFATFQYHATVPAVDGVLTELALERIAQSKPDFVFLYMPEVDEVGHAQGWMTPPYLEHISAAISNVRRVVESVGQEYTVIVTADHGGHDRTHGTTMPEDMTIPMFFIGPDFTPGQKLENVSMLDIAPTITDVLGILPAPEWEGKSLK